MFTITIAPDAVRVLGPGFPERRYRTLDSACFMLGGIVPWEGWSDGAQQTLAGRKMRHNF